MLAKLNRIAKKKDFEYIFKNGKTIKNNFFILKVINNNLSEPRFAIITSLKVSKKAVERNRIRRIVMGVLQNSFNNIKSNLDIIFIVLPTVSKKTREEIRQKTQEILNKI